LMPLRFINVANSSNENWLPLSDIICAGVPLHENIDLRTSIAFLNLLHESHPGVIRIKTLARSYVWRPGIDCDIEKLVKQHFGCQKNQNMPAITPLHPWEWPSSPWQRVHIDLAGPFLDRMFFVGLYSC
jgi:hypothetical protein